jgi:hypothetical protein
MTHPVVPDNVRHINAQLFLFKLKAIYLTRWQTKSGSSPTQWILSRPLFLRFDVVKFDMSIDMVNSGGKHARADRLKTNVKNEAMITGE